MKARCFLLFLMLTSLSTFASAASDSALTGTTTNAVPVAPPPGHPAKPDATTNISVNTPPPVEAPAVESHVVSLMTSDIQEFADLTPSIQALIASGLELTRLNLKYQYGSDDPRNGGMDCSGTMHYLLEKAGLKDVPRDSSEIYRWVWTKSHVVPVTSSQITTFELDRLRPGDLLFWTGTYDIQRDPPITHVMLYLGTNRQTGRRVMVGASEGRTYGGKPRYGVSVFDFTLPGTSPRNETTNSSSGEPQSRFIGYGPVPGL